MNVKHEKALKRAAARRQQLQEDGRQRGERVLRDAIVSALEGGATLREIGEVLGLSHVRVHQIRHGS